MDSKSNANKVWVTKLRHAIRIRELDEALSRRRLRAEEIRLLPRGRAVLIFSRSSEATLCLAQRGLFRYSGENLGSEAFVMKYDPGYEDGPFRGEANFIQAKVSDDVYELFSQSRDTLTAVVERYNAMWFYSSSHGLYLRGHAADVKKAYDHLENHAVGIVGALIEANRRENGERERNTFKGRRNESRFPSKRNKGRGKNIQNGHRHYRDDDFGYAEYPIKREGDYKTYIVRAPNHVTAYVRRMCRDDLRRLIVKYGVIMYDHQNGTIVKATARCEPGWLRDACRKLKTVFYDVAGFVEETNIELERYGLDMGDVTPQLFDIEQSFPDVLITRRTGNVLHMVGDENDLHRAKITILQIIQQGEGEGDVGWTQVTSGKSRRTRAEGDYDRPGRIDRNR